MYECLRWYKKGYLIYHLISVAIKESNLRIGRVFLNSKFRIAYFKILKITIDYNAAEVDVDMLVWFNKG